jgi:4-amino-4-deoxy-L-arabinose transferase-like glycosyltransferase
MKPVRLAASATTALPRWALYALCLLYILPGLIGRDPWKNADATGFGVMWTMAHGSLHDWLWPNVVGLPIPDHGPLAFWLGALCIKLFGGLLGDPMAARVSLIFFFLIGAVSIWFCTYLLGRRAEAQPLKLAFGGHPSEINFARMLADGALLIYLASLGLLVYSHETTASALHVSLIALLLCVCAYFLEAPSYKKSLALGGVLSLLMLTYNWLIPLFLFLSILCLLYMRHKAFWKYTGTSLVAPGLLVGLVWLLKEPTPWVNLPLDFWIFHTQQQIALPSWSTLGYFFRGSFWFTWPAWPFAAWAIYAWRRQYKGLHIALPLVFIVVLFLATVCNPRNEERALLSLLPPLAILAAFGLPTMKRGAINAIDWFAVMILSFFAGFIWLAWIAKQTNWPPQLAKNVLKLAPGFKSEVNLLALAIALCATILWIWLIHWRLSRQPKMLWRAAVLSSGGIIFCWLLLMTLWLPWVNYGKSYRSVAEKIRQNLPLSSYCVDANIGSAQRASFAYFGKIDFARTSSRNCLYFLTQDNLSRKNQIKLFERSGEKWQLLWEGRRPSDRDERFRLFKRINE